MPEAKRKPRLLPHNRGETNENSPIEISIPRLSGSQPTTRPRGSTAAATHRLNWPEEHVPHEPHIEPRATRRVELTLHKPWFALYAGVRPTLVIDGRGQPVQWGVGTWQLPADAPSTLAVYLFNRVWRFGRAEVTVMPEHPAILYRAPALPFTRGRMQVPHDGLSKNIAPKPR